MAHQGSELEQKELFGRTAGEEEAGLQRWVELEVVSVPIEDWQGAKR